MDIFSKKKITGRSGWGSSRNLQEKWMFLEVDKIVPQVESEHNTAQESNFTEIIKLESNFVFHSNFWMKLAFKDFNMRKMNNMEGTLQ